MVVVCAGASVGGGYGTAARVDGGGWLDGWGLKRGSWMVTMKMVCSHQYSNDYSDDNDDHHHQCHQYRDGHIPSRRMRIIMMIGMLEQ